MFKNGTIIIVEVKIHTMHKPYTVCACLPPQTKVNGGYAFTPVCLSVGPICENPEGPLFLPEFVCLSVCVSVDGTSTS